MGPSDQFAIGAGGIDYDPVNPPPNPAILNVPLSLTAPQIWSLGPGALSLAGGLSGPASDPLTLDLASGTLYLTGANDVVRYPCPARAAPVPAMSSSFRAAT